MGFDYFYGFMGGETNQWTPYLFKNTTQIFPWVGKPGYNLTTDLADDAIDYLRQTKAAAPDKPFFLYFVPGGTHAPHQPTPEWIDKFKGKFDMGWNAMRDQIFANQKRLGVIPANTALTPGRTSLPKWDTLSADEKEAVRPPGRGLRRLCRLHRLRDRPGHPGGRGPGQARQHAHHLYRAATTARAPRARRSARRSIWPLSRASMCRSRTS